MPPKTNKNGDNAWRKQIESAIIEDEKFQFQAVIMECAGSEQDFMYLTKFEEFAAEEKRYVVKNITKKDTNFMVNQLGGGEKKIQDESLRIFEEAFEAMKQNNMIIPTDILALLIKYQIIEMKTKYLAVQREKRELNAGMRQESVIMLDPVEVKGTVTKPLQETVETPKSTKKGKKDDADDVITTKEGKKYNTILRERGEEWRDKTYVDDFPIDGPNLYVIITGFSEPMLLINLVNTGIKVSALIQLRVDSQHTHVPSSLIRISKRGQSKTELQTEAATQFWTDVQNLRIKPVVAKYFKDTAFIAFKPPYWESELLKGEPESIYDDISFLLYDIQDLGRQHIHYLDNMNLVHITKEETPNLTNFDHYTVYANQIPNESITAFFVLNSILNAITKSDVSSESTSQRIEINSNNASSLTPRNPVFVGSKDKQRLEKTQQLVEDVFIALETTHSEKQKIVSNTQDDCSFENPAVIDFGDYLSTLSFHFQNNLNIPQIYSVFKGMVLTRLWDPITKQSDDEKSKINYHLKVLAQSFDIDDFEYSKLYRLLNILAFRRLFDHRSSNVITETTQVRLDEFKRTYLKRNVLSEPLHPIIGNSSSNSTLNSGQDESIHEISWKSSNSVEELEKGCISSSNLFECLDINDIVLDNEIDSQKIFQHMIDDFEYFEDHDLKTSLQILNKFFNEYNCVNYKYFKFMDVISLLFYNAHNTSGIFLDEWKTSLTTPVCLQDFFDFVLDEQHEWLQNEEKYYDEIMDNRYKTSQSNDLASISNRSCIEKNVLDMDMLVDGSLKHEEYIQLERATSIISSTTASPRKSKGTKPNVSISNTTVSSKSSTKNASTKGSKTVTSLKSSSVHSVFPLENFKVKHFLGYDLGDRRIEIFGRNAAFFSDDETKVFTKYFTLFPQNEEYVNLQVCSGNGSAQIFVHKPLGIYTKPILHETIRILTKNNVQITFQVQSFEELPQLVPDIMQSSEKLRRQKFSALNIVPAVKKFNSLAITCHNGLVIETVHESKSPAVSHIRQYYLVECKALKSEEKRCISKSGEVIIFKKSGEIEILCPDSSRIFCTKYEKKVVETKSSPSSEVNVRDSIMKKKNTKESPNVKSKGKAKSVSLVSLVEIEAKVEPVYELEIQEFSVIEADGRKRYCYEGVFHEKELLLIRTATDYNVGEVFSRRMDGTNTLCNENGILSVTFPNNTQIISEFYIHDDEVLPEWTDEEIEYFEIFKPLNLDERDLENDSRNDLIRSEKYIKTARCDGYVSIYLKFTIEHVNFATVTIDTATREFSVDLPNSVSIIMDDQSNYKVQLDKITTLSINSEFLHMEYIACPELGAKTLCDINISRYDNADKAIWLRLRDSYGKRVIVNFEGILQLDEEVIGETNLDEAEEEKPNTFTIPCDKCRESQFVEKYRFVVLNKDHTISELIHKLKIENYKKKCRLHAWGSISNYEVFGDKRRILSLLHPINYTQAQKWLMNPKFAKKPKNMVFKDLGKGFYKWMRPYERCKPEIRLPPLAVEPEPPKAFILRTLEKQWRERDREKYKGGKELVKAIIKYRRRMEEDKEMMTTDPVLDPRTPEEVENYERVQQLIQRTIKRMQKKLYLFEDAQCDEPKPLKLYNVPLETCEDIISEEGLEEETVNSATAEEAKDLVQELETVAEMRPSLQRYWRLRAEEERETLYYKEVLRLGYVPPYFDNILGGAMWYDVNKSVEAATANDAEARRPKCDCDENLGAGDSAAGTT